MPRTDNFQGLASPFFPADPYYFAENTNPAPKRPSRSKTQTSLSSDSAPSQILSKETSLAGSKDDSTSQTSPSHARAHSTAASSSPRSDTSSFRKRPSTAASSTNSPQSRHPPSLVHPALSLIDIPLPAIAADDNMDTTNSPPLPDSTTILPPAMPKFDIKNGKRHHPYPSKIVPYPRSYDSTAIDQSVFMLSVFASKWRFLPMTSQRHLHPHILRHTLQKRHFP
jgi:hypothetical protein